MSRSYSLFNTGGDYTVYGYREDLGSDVWRIYIKGYGDKSVPFHNSFRNTDKLKDVVVNGVTLPNVNPTYAKIVDEFRTEPDSWFSGVMATATKVIIEGHGAGAAIALVYGTYLKLKTSVYSGDIEIVTYGAPPVGGEGLKAIIDSITTQYRIIGDSIVDIYPNNYVRIGNIVNVFKEEDATYGYYSPSTYEILNPDVISNENEDYPDQSDPGWTEPPM